MTRNRLELLRVVLLLLMLWGAWSLRLGARFYGEQDSFRTWIPAAARNYQIYDYDDIGLIVTRTAYLTDASDLTRYSHHPPLLAWLPALLMQVAGENEVSARFVFLVATMIASAAFYALVKQLYDKRIAFWSLLFFGMTPMIAYFQPSYGHDPLGFMAFMLFGLMMLVWLKRPTLLRYFVLISLAIFATLTAWPAVIFMGMIGIFGMFFGGGLQRVGIVILGVIAIVSIVIMLLLYELWWSGAVNSLLGAYVWRTSNYSLYPGSEPFTAAEFVIVNLHHLIYFGTFGVLLLGIAGLGLMWRYGNRFSNLFVLVLALAALLYTVVFSNATYIHTYYKAFWMPSLAIGTAFMVVYRGQLHRRLRPVIDALVLTAVVQSIVVLSMLVGTTHNPSLTRVIDYINALSGDEQPIYITYVGINTGSEFAVEYYTQRNVEWNVLPADMPDNPTGQLIFCAETQPDLAILYDNMLPVVTSLDEVCTVYDLE